MRSSRTIEFILMLGPLFALGNLAAQNIDVLVLDALNGKPQQGVLVHWFCEGQRPASSDERTTDNNGIAEVPFPCGNQGRIELSVLAPDWKKHAYAKTECGELGPITLQNISQAGIISNPSADGNIWCPTKISRKLKPVPGQVTIFIKKPTWYQVHFAG